MSQEQVKVSPARATRVQEKEELAYLNDRFVQYIEQVRSMKETNLRLEMELCSTKEQLGSEADAVKALYESELAEARNLIDETAKEKARQQILATKNANRVEALEAELAELKEALERMEGKYNGAERNATSLDARLKSCLADKSKLQKQVKDLEGELAEKIEAYESVKNSLEAETLGKVDIQNHIQSLKEELAFRRKVYEEELAALREKLSLSVSGVLETDFQAQLDRRLEIAIDELREKSEADIADYKCQIDRAYTDKIEALETQSARDSATISKLSLEIRKLTSTRSEHGGEISRLQRMIEKLEASVRDKDDELGRLRGQHSEEMAQRLEELRSLRERYELKIKEYEELHDIKVQLDQEIATYRALLQEEEKRLNLTPTPREVKRTRPRTEQQTSSFKKQRLEENKKSVSSSSAGRIQITDVDADGQYITIQNMSDEVESLKGLKIQQEVDGENEVSFRFSNKSKLQGGASVTVWSGDAEDAVHSPPTNLTWKNQSWGSGRKTITKLIKGGDEIAQFTQTIEISPVKASGERDDVDTDSAIAASSPGTHSFPHLPVDREVVGGRSQVTTTTTTYTSSTSTGGSRSRVTGGEHMFHQQGDPDAQEKSCIIS